MNQSIRAVLVGAGHVAHKHAETLVSCEYFDLVGAFDVDSKRCVSFSKQYGCASLAWDDVIRNEKRASLAILCTPSGTHFELAERLLNSGYDVLVEKPLSLCSQDARVLRDLAERLGRKLFSVFQLRSSTGLLRLTTLHNGGALGEVNRVLVNMHWSRNEKYFQSAPWRKSAEMDGGILWNQAIHYFDALCILFPGLTCSYASIRNFGGFGENPDSAIVVLHSREGAELVVSATTSLPPEDVSTSLHYVARKGSATIVGADFSNYTVTPWTESDVSVPPTNFEESQKNLNLERMYVEIWNSMALGIHSTYAASEHIRTLELLESIQGKANDSRFRKFAN